MQAVSSRVGIAIPAEGQGGDDAEGGDGGRDVVDLRSGEISCRAGFEPELENGIAREHFRVGAGDPEAYKGPPLPGEEYALEERWAEDSACRGDGRETLDGELLFSRTEISCGGAVRCVWECEEAIDANGEGDEEINHKQPSPTGQTGFSIEGFENRALQNAREQRSCEARTGEDGRSLADFFGFIPTAQNPLHAHKARRLKSPLPKANDHNLPRMPRKRRAQRQQTPTETRRRQPDTGRAFLQNQIIRDLADQVAGVENGVDLIELRAAGGEVQLFACARDVCVAEVGAVEVVDPVHETHVRENEAVEFEEEMAFFARRRRFSPDGDAERVKDFSHFLFFFFFSFLFFFSFFLSFFAAAMMMMSAAG